MDFPNLSSAVRVASVALVLGALALTSSCSSAGELGRPVSSDAEERPSSVATDEQFLFSLRGSGSLVADQLEIAGITAVTFITDRPNRQAGRMTSEDLVAGWASFGFDDDPPNAILLTDGGSRAVELGTPSSNDEDRIVVPVTPLGADALTSGELGEVELLIDDVTSCDGNAKPTTRTGQGGPPLDALVSIMMSDGGDRLCADLLGQVLDAQGDPDEPDSFRPYLASGRSSFTVDGPAGQFGSVTFHCQGTGGRADTGEPLINHCESKLPDIDLSIWLHPIPW